MCSLLNDTLTQQYVFVERKASHESDARPLVEHEDALDTGLTVHTVQPASSQRQALTADRSALLLVSLMASGTRFRQRLKRTLSTLGVLLFDLLQHDSATLS